jgi:hypothetical protein
MVQYAHDCAKMRINNKQEKADIITSTEVVLLARQSLNLSLEPGVLDDFCKYAGPKGIKISAWVNAKMKEFIEDEKAKAELKNLKKRLE